MLPRTWRTTIGLSLIHIFADGVGLVAVGHDRGVARHAHGVIDDQRRVGQLALVKGVLSMVKCYKLAAGNL